MLGDVQLAGFGGGSAAAAGPSPLPEAPWHETQFVSTVFFAFPIPFVGFFVALASAGATHGPWAETTVTPAQARSETAATAMLSDFQNGLMTPPLALLLAQSNIVMSFTNNEAIKHSSDERGQAVIRRARVPASHARAARTP